MDPVELQRTSREVMAEQGHALGLQGQQLGAIEQGTVVVLNSLWELNQHIACLTIGVGQGGGAVPPAPSPETVACDFLPVT